MNSTLNYRNCWDLILSLKLARLRQPHDTEKEPPLLNIPLPSDMASEFRVPKLLPLHQFLLLSGTNHWLERGSISKYPEYRLSNRINSPSHNLVNSLRLGRKYSCGMNRQLTKPNLYSKTNLVPYLKLSKTNQIFLRILKRTNQS